MIKWLKNLFFPRKSMTAEELAKSWAEFSNEQPIQLTDLSKPLKNQPKLQKATTRSKTMPLVKSAKPAAFKKNIATSVKEGKPVKQAVAIANSEAREAKKPSKTTKPKRK